jgi:hypothetical protein
VVAQAGKGGEVALERLRAASSGHRAKTISFALGGIDETKARHFNEDWAATPVVKCTRRGKKNSKAGVSSRQLPRGSLIPGLQGARIAKGQGERMEKREYTEGL